MNKIEANPDIDPKELEASRMRWHGFTTMIKYSSFVTAVVLILMLAFVY